MARNLESYASRDELCFAEARGHAQPLVAQADAEVQRLQTNEEIKRLRECELSAQAYAKHPAFLRMWELETLTDFARNANAPSYIGFDTYMHADGPEEMK